MRRRPHFFQNFNAMRSAAFHAHFVCLGNHNFSHEATIKRRFLFVKCESILFSTFRYKIVNKGSRENLKSIDPLLNSNLKEEKNRSMLALLMFLMLLLLLLLRQF
jgi:hypothetical protein